MNLSLYIAGRYMFSRKSHQVINIISAVAISGVALAAAAMVCAVGLQWLPCCRCGAVYSHGPGN